MKLLLILDTLLPLLAIIQLLRAIRLSLKLEVHLSRADRKILEEVGLLFLLSQDKKLVQRLGRIILFLLTVANLCLLIISVNRIDDNWMGYAPGVYSVMAVIIHLSLCLAAHFSFLIYNRSDLSFLKNIRI